MNSVEHEIELEDGEINDLEDGEIEDDEMLPEVGTRSAHRNTPPQDTAKLNKGFASGVPRYLRKRPEDRVLGPIYDQPNYWQGGPLPHPSIPRQGGHFMNPRGGERGGFQFRGRGRPNFPERGRYAPGRDRLKPAVPRRISSPRVRTPSPPPNRLETESKDKDDFEMLLERHKLIQQQLESLERQEQAALDSDIDDSFIDIPIGDNDVEIAGGSGGELNDLKEGKTSLQAVHGRSGAEDPGDDARTEELTNKAFEPFKIKPLHPTIPSIQERSRIDIEARGAQSQTSEETNFEGKIRIILGESVKRSDPNPNPTPEDKSASRKKNRRLRATQSKNKRRAKRRLEARNKLIHLGKSDLYAPREVKAKLLGGPSTDKAAGGFSSKQGPKRNAEITDKQRIRRERVKEWQEKKKNQRLHQKVSEKGSKVAGQNEYKEDDYLEMPMEVESDSADGPALPLIEEPTGDFPPPPPPREAALGYGFMPGQGMHPTQMGHVPSYPGVQMMQGSFEPYLPDPQYPGWMSAGPLPVAVHGHKVYIKPDSSSPSQQTTTESTAAKPVAEEDDDDEDALRQLLLKSLANKKKVRQDENQGTKTTITSGPATSARSTSAQNSSATNTPRSLSPVTAVAATKLAKGPGKQTQTAMFAPPQHDPVVINLGEDSDSDSDDERPSAVGGDSARGQFPASLFGGLEMMIKEARKSVEASRGKSTSTKEPNTAGQEEAKSLEKEDAKMPPPPKTPDAMDHMPEERKEEYRRLKEQLARREKRAKQPRQPLSTINQEGERSLEASHLAALNNQVKESEAVISKHKKVLGQDEALLATVLGRLAEKSSLLEAQEAQVAKLKEQLQAAQGVAIANRVLIRKLQEQSTTIRERVDKKAPAVGQAEEELLRARSLLSMANKAAATPSDKERATEGGTNENREAVVSCTAIQEMVTALEAGSRKLSEFTNAGKAGLTKRKIEDTEEEIAKKPKVATSSPSSTASASPRKSAVAERIAVEKARLKKLEQELTEKLKQFGKDRKSGDKKEKRGLETTNDRSSSSGGAFSADANGVDCNARKSNAINETNSSGRIDKSSDNTSDGNSHHSNVNNNNNNNSGGNSKNHLDGPDTRRSGLSPAVDSSAGLSGGDGERAQMDESQQQIVPVVIPRATTQIAVRPQLEISDKQRDYVKTLQNEKEKLGAPFPASLLHRPLAVHQQTAGCVWLESATPEATALEENPKTGFLDCHVTERELPDKISRQRYHSALRYFKAYRLSSYFRLGERLFPNSLTFTNKVDPLRPFCQFDLNGICNDEKCQLQHHKQLKPSRAEILLDLAAYAPTSFECAPSFRFQAKMNARSFRDAQKGRPKKWNERCVLLIDRVKQSRSFTGAHCISGRRRCWALEADSRGSVPEEPDDRGRGVVFPSGHTDLVRTGGPPRDESQEVRYFSEGHTGLETLEGDLEQSPNSISQWLNLARLTLRRRDDEHDQTEGGGQESNVIQALNILSRGLEANSDSEELWLEYLDVFSTRSTSEELRDVCEQAVSYSPTYRAWRKYLDLSHTYADKRTICIRLLLLFSQIPDTNREMNSHRLLDTLLVLVQLDSYTARHKTALADLQGALGRKKHSAMGEVQDLTPFLTPADLCRAWLAYIHVFEFHRLPAAWFDPTCSTPSSMVAMDDFVSPWQPGKGTRAPDDRLLRIFQDALKACHKQTSTSDDRLAVCMPLYRNLVALERAHKRGDSAKGIFRHLLSEAPQHRELWLCLAALSDVLGLQDTGEVYTKALGACGGHAQIAHAAARFYLVMNDSAKAISELIKCVYTKFEASPGEKAEQGGIVALSDYPEVAPDFPEPLALYKKLLSLPVPYKWKCPPLKEGVVAKNLGEEEVFLWLCFCLLHELIDDWTDEIGHRVSHAYEGALHRPPLTQTDRRRVWLSYLMFQRSRVLQESQTESRRVMSDLVNRCLTSDGAGRPLPYSPGDTWHDYSFHNQVISLYLDCLFESEWSFAFDKFLSAFPDNVNLVLRASQHELNKKQPEKAVRICSTFLARNPRNITVWKVLIAIQLQRGCIKEARKLYQQATEFLPFAATLWKDFAMFEIAKGEDPEAVAEIAKKCQDIGVDIAEFLATLTGKSA